MPLSLTLHAPRTWRQAGHKVERVGAHVGGAIAGLGLLWDLQTEGAAWCSLRWAWAPRLRIAHQQCNERAD